MVLFTPLTTQNSHNASPLNPFNAEATFSKSTRTQKFWKPSKPCHVGIRWIALAEFSWMSTYLPGFRSFFPFFLHHFVLAKLATGSIRVKLWPTFSVDLCDKQVNVSISTIWPLGSGHLLAGQWLSSIYSLPQTRVLASRMSGCLSDSLVHEKYPI